MVRGVVVVVVAAGFRLIGVGEGVAWLSWFIRFL